MDKSFYVTGEIIWYKLYLTPNVKEQNIAIKTTLVNAKGNTSGEHFNLSNGKTYISGHYKLPFDLTSEVYSLVFSATRKKYEDEEVFGEVFIPIYNDLDRTPTEDLLNDIDIESYNQEALYNENLNIEITTNKQIYKSREKVNAQIHISDADGRPVVANVSIAVKDTDLIDSGYHKSSVYQGRAITFENNNRAFSNQIYIKGSYIKGIDELTAAKVIGVYSNGENKFHFALPEMSTGNFQVNFPDYYNSKSIQFFPYLVNKEDLKIKLNKVGKKNSMELAYNQSVVDYIKLSRQRKKLFQRYESLESNIKQKEYARDITRFHSNKSFDLTEYTSFENVGSFLKEVSTPLRMKETDGLFKASMFITSGTKSSSRHAIHPPIFILNGYLTRNSDYVGKLNMDLVTSIAMMYDPIIIRNQYEIFGADGLVKLSLKTNEIMLPKSDMEDIYILNGLLPETEYPTFDPKEISNDEYRPFFRPLIYWNPNLTTDDNGDLDISFYQTDDISTFVIEVVVHTNNGSISTGQKTYQSVW